MKSQLRKTDTVAILGLAALAAIVLIVVLAGQQNASIPLTGSTGLSNAAVITAPGKTYEEYTPVERQQYQITESYDPLPVFGAALPAPAAFYAGPDFSAMDLRQREQLQITEEYPFQTSGFAAMDPHERERLQITAYYP